METGNYMKHTQNVITHFSQQFDLFWTVLQVKINFSQ